MVIKVYKNDVVFGKVFVIVDCWWCVVIYIIIVVKLY